MILLKCQSKLLKDENICEHVADCLHAATNKKNVYLATI